MTPDSQGFLIPRVDMNRCAQCGLCRKVCPAPQGEKAAYASKPNPKTYAAWSINTQTRYRSTSGGAFSELAAAMLKRGGYVSGAVYGEDFLVHHEVSNRQNDIERFRQSKYVQSNALRVYTEIAKLLANGEYVLFVGTPCEVSGLKSYLGSEAERLYTADFICLGVNSPMAYKKYLEWLEAKYAARIKRVWFKYKVFSWEQFATRVDFTNGKTYIGRRNIDPFMRGYLESMLYIRPSCKACQCKGFPRHSDITMSDFWGVKRRFPDIDCSIGVSAVFVNTDKGDELLRSAEALELLECDMSDVLKENPRANTSAEVNERQDAFFRDLEETDFRTAVNNHTHTRLVSRIRNELNFCICVASRCFRKNRHIGDDNI